jgi:short-subunit dehydrogenase
MARQFVSRNAYVIVTARNLAKLQELARELGEQCEYAVLDVTSMEEIEQCVGSIIGQHGRIDVWINNAGHGMFEAFTDASLERIDDMMNVNYMGTVRCTKAVLPHMLKSGRGQIVNIASLAGKIGSAKGSGYSASKHAVLGFTNSLRQEVAEAGVIVTAINPGPIDTPFFNHADPTGHYVNNIKWMMLKPEKVAAKIVQAVIRGKKEVDMPLLPALGAKLVQLFPRLMDGWAGKLVNKK